MKRVLIVSDQVSLNKSLELKFEVLSASSVESFANAVDLLKNNHYFRFNFLLLGETVEKIEHGHTMNDLTKLAQIPYGRFVAEPSTIPADARGKFCISAGNEAAEIERRIIKALEPNTEQKIIRIAYVTQNDLIAEALQSFLPEKYGLTLIESPDDALEAANNQEYDFFIIGNVIKNVNGAGCLLYTELSKLTNQLGRLVQTLNAIPKANHGKFILSTCGDRFYEELVTELDKIFTE